jgi:hypothetical protein
MLKEMLPVPNVQSFVLLVIMLKVVLLVLNGDNSTENHYVTVHTDIWMLKMEVETVSHVHTIVLLVLIISKLLFSLVTVLISEDLNSHVLVQKELSMI